VTIHQKIIISNYLSIINEMRTKFTFAAALIVSAASLGIQNAIAKGTPYEVGYSHGCSDAKLTFSERYINQ
jgi:hypothetical protein